MNTHDIYPGPMPDDLARIPDVLKQRNQWVLWKASDRLDKTGAVIGLDKVPYCCDDPDVKAATDNPTTWDTYQRCVDALEPALEQWELDNPSAYRGGGLGYVFTVDDPYCGIDLDHSIDPQTDAIEPWAKTIIQDFQSYTQRSCSGAGLHVVIEATIPPAHNQDGDLQMWDHGRFFAMTGWHVPGTPATIEARQGPLEQLWCAHFGAQVGDLVHCVDEQGVIVNAVPWTIVSIDIAPHGSPYARFTESQTGWPLVRCEVVPPVIATEQPLSPPMTDETILQKASAAANSAKFAQLWAGDWSGYTSQSEADLALCMLLAFYTQEPGQLQRLFEDSGLYRAEKWGKRFDYRRRTIAKALAGCSTFYQPPATLRTSSGHGGAFGSFVSALPWAFPEKLPSGFPDVPTLPAEMLPVALRPWLADIADRQQVPLEFVATPALIALGTVVGRKITIRPKQRDDWLVVPNLWGAIVGRPGVLKSPAMKAALAPLDRLIATAADRYQQELARGQAELAAHEARLKAIKHAMEVVAKKPSSGGKTLDDLTQELIDLQAQAPVLFCERRYRTNDSTIEKLGELFQENPTGLMLFRDELSGWLRSLDKSGREGDREFFLEAWNGDGAFTVDRIGRGTKHIPALCLSLCGGIQPGKLTAYIEDAVAGGYGDDGLLQRFQLLLWPDIPTTWANVDRYPDNPAKNSAYAVYQRLDEAAASWFGCHQDSDSALPHLAFAPDAQDLFDTWRADLEAALRDGSLTCPALESHLAKYRSLMPSLALLFHLVDVATQQTAQPAVSLNAARMAATWCDFLRPHAERVYATVMAQDLHAAHALADHLKRGDIQDGDSVRSVYRRQWSALNTPERVGDALTVLERHHWLRVEEQPTNGRSTEVIVLNPALGQIL